MNCRRVDEILNTHELGRLASVERAELDEHLAACRRCADAMLGHEILADEPAEPARPAFYAECLAVVGETAERESAPRQVARFGRVAGLAAAATIVLGVAALVLLGELAGPELESAAGAGLAAAVSDQPMAPSDGLMADTLRRQTLLEPRTVQVESSAAPFPASQRDVPGLLAGVHYARLPSIEPETVPAGDTIVVCEFFMFLCVHCYQFEPELKAWAENLPDNVELERVPALFNATARLQAQAFYAAEALGIGDAMVDAFYEAIHVRQNPLATEAALAELFARHGVDRQQFFAAFESDGVRENLQRAEALNRQYRINATPTISVNGRYVTNPTMSEPGMGLLDIVDRLVEAEAEAAARAEAIVPPRCDGRDGAGCRQRLLEDGFPQ